MKRLIAFSGALAMVIGLGTFTSSAKAGDFAIHVAGPGYHFDIGRPHYRTSYYRGGHGHHGSHHRHYSRRHVWHDTSHYDYHPGEYVPHGNHYHYVPGHYDWHETGHWDHYRGW
jgi:hypothetical protein